MAEFDWGEFSKEVGKTIATAISDIQTREDEKRKLALYKEKQKIDLGGLNRQLEIQEPFKEKADKRLEDRLKEIANFEQGLKEGWLQYESKYKTNLEASLYDPVWMDVKKKAVTSGDTAQQTLILGLENEINAVLGGKKEFDPRALKGLPPVATQNMAKISYERSQEKIKVQQADQRIQNDKGQTLALKEYRKELARGRRLTQERLATSAGEMTAKRWADERNRLDTNVEKAEKSLGKYRSELMKDLEESKAINAKGNLMVRWARDKNFPLFNPETGELDEKMKDKLLEKYSRFRGRFKRFKQLRKTVETRNERRDEFFGGEPAGKLQESNTWTNPNTGRSWKIGEVGVATAEGKYKGKRVRHLGKGKFELVD